jgi:Tfp pilus assembly protein PilF
MKPPHDAYPKAKDAVSKALAIDEEIPLAHIALAQVLWCYEWDWTAAEGECKRAIELAPSSAETHLAYGVFLEKMGRNEEALNEFNEALHLDPVSVFVRTCTIYLLIRMGEYERANKSLKEATTLDLNISYNFIEGVLASYKGNYDKSICILEKTVPGIFSNLFESWLGYVYGRSGKRHNAENMVHSMIERKRTRYAASVHIAFIYQGLGDYDHAFEWLELALKDREPGMTHLFAYPEWDLLRPDPRFTSLMKRMNLPV